MAGMLTVVNPRRKRRKNARRRKTRNTRRRARARAPRRVYRARRAHNPRRHHRVHNRRHRRVHNRRHRRVHNPFGKGLMAPFMNGLAIGGGAIVTNLATNGINFLIQGGDIATGKAGTNKPLDPIMKTALKAGIGLVALPMLLKFIPGGAKFANKVRIGAAVAVAIDIYDQYIHPTIVTSAPWLSGYDYGMLPTGNPQLGAYREGELSGDVNDNVY